MRVGSLFSGIGGFDLGLERAGYDIAWQVENNEYCREVLKKHWPAVPCHYDIKTIDWRDIPKVDLVCGGFPCQPFSVAGKRRGAADDRYLWPEVVRCLDALRPTWFLGENVPGLINLALDQVCTDLERLGYTVWPVCLPACAVGVDQIRQRVWIIGFHPNTQRVRLQGERVSTTWAWSREQFERLVQTDLRVSLPAGQSGGVSDGIPHRSHRLKGLGNAIVPQIAEALGRMIVLADQEAAMGGR